MKKDPFFVEDDVLESIHDCLKHVLDDMESLEWKISRCDSLEKLDIASKRTLMILYLLGVILEATNEGE